MGQLPIYLLGEEPGTIRIAQALVAILVEHPYATPENRWGVGTGIVFELGGEWLMLTADHVLNHIESAIAAEPATKVSLRTSNITS